MDDVVVEQQRATALSVAAVVTGGIERNGGYPATELHTAKKRQFFDACGTMVIIGADLPDGILCRAFAAKPLLRQSSSHSRASFTECRFTGNCHRFWYRWTRLVSDPASPLKEPTLEAPLLGQLIGGVVRSATKGFWLLPWNLMILI